MIPTEHQKLHDIVSWQTTSPCSTTSGGVCGDFPDNCKQDTITVIIKIEEDVEAMKYGGKS